MIKLIQKATASSKDGAVGLIKGHYRLAPFRIWLYAADRTFILFGQRFTRWQIWAEKQFFTQSAALYALRLY